LDDRSHFYGFRAGAEYGEDLHGPDERGLHYASGEHCTGFA
jgi:hypothetical protein